MFPSSNNGNVDPIYYNDQQGYNNNNRSFFNDIVAFNSRNEEEPPPLSFFHLPSSPLFNPFFDQLELHDHDFFHQQPLKGIDGGIIVNMVESEKNNTSNDPKKEQIQRKRCSKRDRHSKINTAQGPRDRRMRLSLKVAREFFDLQDKLCFDKASKTVEWLLVQARPAINQLCGSSTNQLNNYSASSTSECEVVSGIDEEAAATKGGNASKGKPSSRLNNNKAKKAKPSRKMTFHPFARESREKARARARERTREKQWSRRRMDESSQACEGVKSHELNQLSCWSPFEAGEESVTQSQTINPNSLEMIAEVDEAPNTSDESLVIMGKLSPSSIINHLYNSGFPQEQHQFEDFQSFFKPWEGFQC